MFNKLNPFGDDPEQLAAAEDPREKMKRQVYETLAARMQPVAQPDTAAQEAEAADKLNQSTLVRSGVQIAHAMLGDGASKGDNAMSGVLEQDRAAILAKMIEDKRRAAEQDKVSQELRNSLSTRVIDDDNLAARNKDKQEWDEKQDGVKYDRDRALKQMDMNQAQEIARISAEGKVGPAEMKQAIEDGKSQQKLGKDLGPLQETLNSLTEVESVLGSPLEKMDYSLKSGNVKIDGKEADLPGSNFLGFDLSQLPGVSGNGEARALDTAMARVFNQALKVRSGSAVTDSELARLKREYSQGAFATEAEKIKALQDVKRLLYDAFKNSEGKYNENVVNEYADRGGQTRKDFTPPTRKDDSSPIPPIPKDPATVAKEARRQELLIKAGK